MAVTSVTAMASAALSIASSSPASTEILARTTRLALSSNGMEETIVGLARAPDSNAKVIVDLIQVWPKTRIL